MDDGRSVGEAAALLGLAPATLRSWQRRYGLHPSRRSAGGHRRYTTEDLHRLGRVRELTLGGLAPAAAARLVQLEHPTPDVVGHGAEALRRSAPRQRRTGPGGRVLALPGGTPHARGLARAASQLDVAQTVRILEESLAAHGVLATYDGLIRPVLSAAGELWVRTGTGVEIEHLFSEATTEALRHHRRTLAAPSSPRVVLTCAPNEAHTLPILVLAAALAERGIGCRVSGPRMPAAALRATVRLTRAAAVFIWAQQTDRDLDGALAAIPRLRPAVRVVVGGPGWGDVEVPGSVKRAASAGEALDLLAGL